MSEDKTSIWKKIGIAIGGFFIGLITFIFFGTTNRDNNRSARKHLDRTTDNIGTAADANRTAREQTEDIRRDTSDIRECTEHSLNIIRDLRERAKKK